MVEENSYVVDNDGTISLKPSFLDMIKENIETNNIHNTHIVYLFFNKDTSGIKFYNLNNDNSNKEFMTKKKLVFETEWSILINYPNKSMAFKSDIGSIKIDTYLVNKEEYFRIMNIIKNEEDIDKLISFKINIKKI